jgi:hypothetical protein
MGSVQLFENACSVLNSLPGTVVSGVWFFVSSTFSKYWYMIIPTLIIWIVYELFARHNHRYNSDNGFTPLFNSFVGGGVFLGFEFLITLVLNLFFGKATECVLLFTKSFYLIPFIATGVFLNFIGFWPYLKIPIINIKIDTRFYRK